VGTAVAKAESILKRRTFCRTSVLASGAVLSGFDLASAWGQSVQRAGQAAAKEVVEFANEGHAQMDAEFGEELDGRLYTNLSRLGTGNVTSPNLITPVEKFYVRTRASKLLPEAAGWTVNIGGLVEKPARLKISELRTSAKAMGSHVMECAGNTRAAHFGMISAGEWSGVALRKLVEAAGPKSEATRVLVSGFDQYVANSVTSTPGASWIFALDEIFAANAFLATSLNGKPLTRDHGAPVRLVVPGWYGCTCIKWVDEISLVDDEERATSQMLEYAGRTHQNGAPELAKDYVPARIEHAAMPVRVERWRTAGKVRYRVVGLLWGGSEPVKRLGIRFNPEEEFVDVDALPGSQTGPWTLWSHEWKPAAAGMYTIRLAIQGAAKQPKRLESGYYARSVEIAEV
jgi:DMSO/TMAO reductase YedYZ molybdopterin-dependent catalytic subunit